MFVCCECYVLSGRGLCDELITRPEESYRLWCVVVCDLETSKMRRPWPALGRSATGNKLSLLLLLLLLLLLPSPSLKLRGFEMALVSVEALLWASRSCYLLHNTDLSKTDGPRTWQCISEHYCYRPNTPAAAVFRPDRNQPHDTHTLCLSHLAAFCSPRCEDVSMFPTTTCTNTRRLGTLLSSDTRELGQQVRAGHGDQPVILPPTLSLSVAGCTTLSPCHH